MARNCEKCGLIVGIGHGKWVGDQDRPETLRIYHRNPSECDSLPLPIDANRAVRPRDANGRLRSMTANPDGFPTLPLSYGEEV